MYSFGRLWSTALVTPAVESEVFVRFVERWRALAKNGKRERERERERLGRFDNPRASKTIKRIVFSKDYIFIKLPYPTGIQM